jgi:two-component system heavy metal sensor histidine kinase CusS
MSAKRETTNSPPLAYETAPVDPQPIPLRKHWSLAARLTLWYALSSFALVFCATSLLYIALVHSLDQDADRFLTDRMQDVRLILQTHGPGTPGTELSDELEEESNPRQHTPIFFRVTDQSGKLVAESTGIRRHVPPEAFPKPGDPDIETGRRYRSQNGRPFQLILAKAPAGKSSKDEYLVQAAMDVTFQTKLLRTYRRRLYIALSIAGVACLIVGYQIAKRGIRPVKEITETARRIRSTTLDARIDARRMPGELASLASEFNEMLDRLGDSFERLSRFSADIAHELRTPVNNLRGMAEVALFSKRSADEYRDVLASCMEEYQRLTRMIESLLYLARAEDPKYQISRETLDLGHELELVKEFYDASAAEAGVQIRVDTHGPVSGELNRTLFQRAVGNLIANAITHTPAGGSVTLGAQRQNGTLQVDVSDTGCGIPQEHLPHVFDRLYRVAPDRNKASGGAGLGLAIVKSIAISHGGQVDIESKVGEGTRVSLLFPAK